MTASTLKIKTPTKAQARFLDAIAREGGGSRDIWGRADVQTDAVKLTIACVKAGWLVDLTGGNVALTWAGWNMLPRWFEQEAGEHAGVTASTWADYAGRGIVPPADGFAPHPLTGRATRFWWPWTVEFWVTDRDAATDTRSREGRAAGARQCMWRAPGSTGRFGFCRRTIDPATDTCPDGHVDG